MPCSWMAFEKLGRPWFGYSYWPNIKFDFFLYCCCWFFFYLKKKKIEPKCVVTISNGHHLHWRCVFVKFHKTLLPNHWWDWVRGISLAGWLAKITSDSLLHYPQAHCVVVQPVWVGASCAANLSCGQLCSQTQLGPVSQVNLHNMWGS